jgi:MFS family permease
LFIPLFSAVESTFPVNWSTLGEFFGRRNFAKIRGTMSFIQAWDGVIGPLIAGAIYDSTRSYTASALDSDRTSFGGECPLRHSS